MTDPYNTFEFLTGIQYAGDEYVGIVVNQDSQLLTFYDVGNIVSIEIKQELLVLGDIWWWESNRQIPIDVFLYHEMKPFRPFMKTFITKDTEVLFGPITSLQNLIKKRIKKRSVQLVRRIEK